MRKGIGTCYLPALVLSELSQLTAAEELGVDSATLREYEFGRHRGPGDIANSMMDLYHAEWIEYKHLRKNAFSRKCQHQARAKYLKFYVAGYCMRHRKRGLSL